MSRLDYYTLLQSEIEQKEWEIENIGRTYLHEQELQSKKEELTRLEAQLNAEKQKTN